MKMNKKLLTAAVVLSLCVGSYGTAFAGNLYGTGDGTYSTDDDDAISEGAKYEVPGSGYDHIYGGYNDISTEVKNNRVTVNSGVSIGNVYGGYSGYSGNVNNNSVIISAGTNIGNVFGGKGWMGLVSGNTVMISGGTITGDIYGGCTDANGGDVENNKVIITGGTINDEIIIYGGCVASKGNATNNEVNLGGYIDKATGKVKTEDGWKATVTSGTIKVGSADTGKGKISSGNALNVFSIGNSVKAIEAKSVQLMNFYIPATAKHDDTMLTVTSAVSVEGKTISATVCNSNTYLKVDDTVNLIMATGIDGTFTTGTLSAGGYGDFGLEISRTADGKAIQAKITSVPVAGGDGGDGGDGSSSSSSSGSSGSSITTSPVNENAKSPVETQAAAVSVLNSGADLLAGAGFDNAAAAVANEAANGGSVSVLTPYTAMGGQKLRVSSGSHCDVNGWNINLGFAKKLQNRQGELLLGPVVEYGRGSYDSYLDNGTNGDGKSSYLGGGLIAKQTNKDGLYYEGSLRAGRTKSDYKATTGATAGDSYDSKATYWAAHLGIGKIQQISKADSLDYYGKVFFSRQGGDSVVTSGGTHFDFDATKSLRTRLGFRYNHALNAVSTIYGGLAWQHEFEGTSRAHVTLLGGRYSTPAPSVKGDTGILELGWRVKPGQTDKFELDLGLAGHVGKQRGVTANAQLLWKF